MNTFLGHRAGIELIENPNLVIADGTQLIPRTCKERLFTLPWRPWYGYTKQTKYKPDPNFYSSPGNNSIIAHPKTLQLLKDSIARQHAEYFDKRL